MNMVMADLPNASVERILAMLGDSDRNVFESELRDLGTVSEAELHAFVCPGLATTIGSFRPAR